MKLYTTAYWGPALTAAAPDLQVGPMLRWIARESGGNPADVPANGFEVGIGQFNTQDGPQFGYTREQLHGTGAWTASALSKTVTRDLTADEEAIQVDAMIKQVRQNQQQANEQSSGWGARDLWALTKMNHALGHGGTTYLANKATAAGHMSSWSDFKGFVQSLKIADVAPIAQYYGSPAAPFARFFNMSEDIASGYDPTGLGASLSGIASLDLLTGIALGALALLALWFAR